MHGCWTLVFSAHHHTQPWRTPPPTALNKRRTTTHSVSRSQYLPHDLASTRSKTWHEIEQSLEWTVLAAFILSYPTTTSSSKSRSYSLISLATGLKCQPYTSLPPNGDVLHDQHAEVLARRGARLWLLNRLQYEAKSRGKEGEVRVFEDAKSGGESSRKRWRLAEGVKVHLYVSTLPCGDASTKLLEFQRAAQDVVACRPDYTSPEELLELYSSKGARQVHADLDEEKASFEAEPLLPPNTTYLGIATHQTRPTRFTSQHQHVM